MGNITKKGLCKRKSKQSNYRILRDSKIVINRMTAASQNVFRIVKYWTNLGCVLKNNSTLIFTMVSNTRE